MPILTRERSRAVEVLFSRDGSLGDLIEGLIGEVATSLDAALYRFNSQRLSKALRQASRRGVQIRLLADRNKYDESEAMRRLLGETGLPFRLTYGRDGTGSKMHHKFAVFDHSAVLTGSYNWTFASEERNYENILLLKEARVIAEYRSEFEVLWTDASEGEKM